jgi:type II secretory pathway pseudopilin PulG
MAQIARNRCAGLPRRIRAGFTLVELLVGGLIMAVSLAAIVSLFAFAFTITQQNDDKSVAYNIARKELEQIRFEGFANALVIRDANGVVTSKFRDGSRVTYYSASGNALPNSTGAAYRATLTITSDELVTLSDGSQRPADDCLRTVKVAVAKYPSAELVFTDGTFMARSGV